jgi:hypothetical protein
MPFPASSGSWLMNPFAFFQHFDPQEAGGGLSGLELGAALVSLRGRLWEQGWGEQQPVSYAEEQAWESVYFISKNMESSI